jgi:hypothetical protein
MKEPTIANVLFAVKEVTVAPKAWVVAVPVQLPLP